MYKKDQRQTKPRLIYISQTKKKTTYKILEWQKDKYNMKMYRIYKNVIKRKQSNLMCSNGELERL